MQAVLSNVNNISEKVDYLLADVDSSTKNDVENSIVALWEASPIYSPSAFFNIPDKLAFLLSKTSLIPNFFKSAIKNKSYF